MARPGIRGSLDPELLLNWAFEPEEPDTPWCEYRTPEARHHTVQRHLERQRAEKGTHDDDVHGLAEEMAAEGTHVDEDFLGAVESRTCASPDGPAEAVHRASADTCFGENHGDLSHERHSWWNEVGNFAAERGDGEWRGPSGRAFSRACHAGEESTVCGWVSTEMPFYASIIKEALDSYRGVFLDKPGDRVTGLLPCD